jgi:hypothetical protein
MWKFGRTNVQMWKCEEPMCRWRKFGISFTLKDFSLLKNKTH